MAKTTAERVREARNKHRAAGLRPVQLWVPDTRAPSFPAEIRRQCKVLAAAEATPEGRADTAFWEAVATEAWDDLP